METGNHPLGKKTEFKERQLSRIFEGIEDEISLMTATAKFNFTTRKTNENDLKIVLSYIEDTKKIAELLKTRILLLSEAIT